MSVWHEKENDGQQSTLAAMADVSFKIDCPRLAVDHAAALSESLCDQQPWLKDLQNTGIHSIHVAGSQNGWQRPEQKEDTLLLSKRTRLKIRINSDQAERLIICLSGSEHTICDHRLKILGGQINHLKPVATLFSRHTVYLRDQAATSTESLSLADEEKDEQILVQQVMNDCKALGYTPTKILCGRLSTMTTAAGVISARSVLLADVPFEYSLLLQEQGLGDLRLMGCGILIPHKDTGAVS